MMAIAISVIMGHNTRQIRQKRDFPFCSSDRSKCHFFLKARHGSSQIIVLVINEKIAEKYYLASQAIFGILKILGRPIRLGLLF